MKKEKETRLENALDKHVSLEYNEFIKSEEWFLARRRLKMKDERFIAVDFDGTLTSCDSYPNIGRENPHAIRVIKKLKKDGCKIILNTCRQGKPLKEAVEWVKSKGVELYAVNDNPWATEKWGGTDCKKVFAHVYIDDRNAFIKKTKTGAVDWKWIDKNYSKLLKG